MTRVFSKLKTELKSCIINPGFHFMYNKASTELKIAMATMYINYLLFSPSNHRENNADISIQAFKNYFIAVLFKLDKYFHVLL